uniref:Egg protein n=1 Tax=Heterorhabditis bacteriophora TaxID=37862 RepID=A0A1I7XEF0_HETBA
MLLLILASTYVAAVFSQCSYNNGDISSRWQVVNGELTIEFINRNIGNNQWTGNGFGPGMVDTEKTLYCRKGWVDMDEKVHAVYVSNLPLDITDEQFKVCYHVTVVHKTRYMENQNRMFEWKPDKPRNYRPISDCTAIIKNLFTLEMMEVSSVVGYNEYLYLLLLYILQKNAALMMDLKEEVQESCSKYGVVKKVVVYDISRIEPNDA